MDKKTRIRTGTNAALTLLLIMGIIVLLNVLSQQGFGRLDLTENGVYTLSEASREAVAGLEDLEVHVYISKTLPEEVELGQGSKLSLRGLEQQFIDKLEEYRSYSEGHMSLLRVEEDIERKAENAKLPLFSADEAKLDGNRLEFTRYAFGATFSYKNVTEVFPLALNPAHYEREITKILLRLKEKYEQGLLMADILEQGAELFDAVEACNTALKKVTSDEGPEGEALALGAGDPVQKMIARLTMQMPDLQAACDPIADKLGAAETTLRGRNPDLDRLLDSVQQFTEFYGQMLASFGAADTQQQALQIAGLLDQLFAGIDSDHDLLVNSPGRRTIGFLCGHQEFCPFASGEPIVRPELAQIMGQQNPFVGRFVQQVQQIEERIDGINESIRDGLFTRQGFLLEKIDPETPIPADVNALVIYGPRKPFSDRTMYELDQFILSGRPVVILTNRYDIAVRNLDNEGEQTVTRLETTESNVYDLLAHYGVKVSKDLVLEPERNAPLVLTELVRQGQIVWQSQRPFPYPLLPTISTLNQEQALVRGLASLTMPYASPLDASAAEAAGVHVDWLARSSDKAVAKHENLPLLPPQTLASLQTEQPSGPHDVALILTGELTSYFAGKEIPATKDGEEKKDDPSLTRRDQGTARLLVIGSSLGLEGLDAGRVFEGFDMSQLTGGGFDFIQDARKYVTRFQNWQERIQQLGDALQDTVAFLPNVLDWAVQNEALVSIRSKGSIQRPIVQVSEGAQRAIRYAGVLLAPLLFLGFGVVRWQIRRRRRPTL